MPLMCRLSVSSACQCQAPVPQTSKEGWWVLCLSHWPKQRPCCRPPSLALPPSGRMWPTWQFESHTAAREWPGHYSGRLHEWRPSCCGQITVEALLEVERLGQGYYLYLKSAGQDILQYLLKHYGLMPGYYSNMKSPHHQSVHLCKTEHDRVR
ncbi:hypothetical protein HaLaN_07193 [Haematococcus lacustris]|uniref:Uncharacterized protein n=1 Tax=Haematococcus lacustris TaxID=44745 RepID=A0A699YYI7_HAELA|nr:hypothetical protein HaLaN_07193 [Haematococcus lacustris]